jgi:hypothetical protein
LDDFKPQVEIGALSGDNLYSHRVTCLDWQHHDAALKHVTSYYREHRAGFEFEPFLRFSDPVNQFLLASGCTHYKEMDLDALNVLYIAIRALASGGATRRSAGGIRPSSFGRRAQLHPCLSAGSAGKRLN